MPSCARILEDCALYAVAAEGGPSPMGGRVVGDENVRFILGGCEDGSDSEMCFVSSRSRRAIARRIMKC